MSTSMETKLDILVAEMDKVRKDINILRQDMAEVKGDMAEVKEGVRRLLIAVPEAVNADFVPQKH